MNMKSPGIEPRTDVFLIDLQRRDEISQSSAAVLHVVVQSPQIREVVRDQQMTWAAQLEIEA